VAPPAEVSFECFTNQLVVGDLPSVARKLE